MFKLSEERLEKEERRRIKICSEMIGKEKGLEEEWKGMKEEIRGLKKRIKKYEETKTKIEIRMEEIEK